MKSKFGSGALETRDVTWASQEAYRHANDMALVVHRLGGPYATQSDLEHAGDSLAFNALSGPQIW